MSGSYKRIASSVYIDSNTYNLNNLYLLKINLYNIYPLSPAYYFLHCISLISSFISYFINSTKITFTYKIIIMIKGILVYKFFKTRI